MIDVSEILTPQQVGKILIDTGPSERGWHRLETFAHCPQLFAYRYAIGLEIPSIPLVRGTLGHVALAHYYARLMAQQQKRDPNIYFDPLEAVDEKIKRIHASGPAASAKIADEVRDSVRTAVTAYMANYAMESMKVFAVEAVARMHFQGHLLTQRFDLVTVDRGGKFWIYDHKFVGSIQAKSTKRYTLSGQFLEMVWQGRNAFGDKFGGCRVNLIGCEGAEPTFHRETPPPAPQALSMFPQAVVDIETGIARLQAEGRDPWNYPKVLSEIGCVTPYGQCPATELCRWGPAAASSASEPS